MKARRGDVALQHTLYTVSALLLAASAAFPLSAQRLTAPRSAIGSAAPRIEVAISLRTLWVIAGQDTLREAPVSVSTGDGLRFGERYWSFATPTGRHVIRTKRADPVWTPPDWHYAEAALSHGFKLKRLPRNGVRLQDGRRIAVHGEFVSVQLEETVEWIPLPEDEHIVFDSTLYIPPVGTRNREVRGELGPYALYLGDGYLLHGTRNQRGVGTASTHGCVRLRDEDITWLFLNIEVGTPVLIRH